MTASDAPALAQELGGDGEGPVPGQQYVVGTGRDATSQLLVPAGVWQRTPPSGDEALVSCLVSLGFDFDDFELA